MTTPPDVWPPQPDSPWVPMPPPPASDQREGFAVAALVLGVVPVLGGLLGVVFGVIGFRRARRTGQKGRVMAAWGASLGALWLLSIGGVIAAAVVSGEGGRMWQDTGSIALGDLRVGDCVNDVPQGVVTALEVVACGDPHRAEVYDLHDLAAGPYPGDTQVERFSRGRCHSTLDRYVGVAPGVDSGYEPIYYAPTRETWAIGDREVVCVLKAQAHAVMTHSVRARGVLPGFSPAPKPTPVARPGQTAGDVVPGALRVGDCVASLKTGVVPTVPLVPCSRPHQAEVYALTALPAGAYPGETDVLRLSEGQCAKRLPRYLGTRSSHGGYGIFYFYPSKPDWVASDRSVTCMLQDPRHQSLTGSAKGRGSLRR